MLCTAVCIEYDINNVISIDDGVAIRLCLVTVERTLRISVLLIPDFAIRLPGEAVGSGSLRGYCNGSRQGSSGNCSIFGL